MNRYVTWPAYIHDLAIFDDRLTAVENKVGQIMELLKGISKDLSNGCNNKNGKQEEVNKRS